MRARHDAVTFPVALAASAVSGLALASVTSTARATAPEYQVIAIPTLPGYPVSRTTRMNDLGHAVGGNWTCPYILSCLGRAFFYDGTDTHDFSADLIESLPPGDIGVTYALDINDADEILVRLTIIDVGLFTYLFRDNEEFVPITAPGAESTIAWAINASGTAVGYYTTATGTRAFTWTADGGVMDVIEPPPGFTSSSGRGINDAGDVVGGLSGGAGADRGFIWSHGAIRVLEPLPGDDRSVAYDVNESGLVVGESIDAGNSESLVVWRDGAIVDSVTLPYDTVLFEIDQINDDGLVVGSFWPLYDELHEFAFRWSRGTGFQQIDTLDLSIPDLDLWHATGVNGSGQVAAWGEYPGFVVGSFLLTPVQACPADLDGSGEVGFADLLTVIGAWGPCAGCPEDLNANGAVDFADLLAVIGAWGACP